MMGYGGGWWMLWMVVFWIVVVGLALWLLSRLFPGSRERPDRSWDERPTARGTDTSVNGTGRAIDILKERYARGEISRAEYLEMRRDLEQ